MRKILACLGLTMLIALVGCVTINVYFPAAAAQKAADQFIGSVIDQGTPSPKPAQNGPKGDGTSKPAPDGGMPSARVLDLLIPAAYAGDSPNLKIHTPAIDAIHARMRKRFSDSLKTLLDDGAVGFTQDGLVQVHDLSAAPMAQRAEVKSVVAAENGDRNQLYADIAKANGHPEWQDRIRQTFAQLWIQRAHKGWYYRSSTGSWKRK
ncbi:YdbL family protein [Oleiagrimonas sp.]|jgi:uncharacterized protein YdbL (DUF1318 family)|uniref:YdbL family protein n=1 Tax=Oleiagrimonas sp. TaxID=2010330 RepID=UPI002612776D|nr:YdbL family protein [Oleiagrimonas sp.]MDA3914632.1 YdbL family protein [Oleiagrimonas sp.]